MRLGLGREFALLDEPEGDEPRVSRLGSSNSISSTSSCSSTSWSRMHFTEYWPNTQSYKTMPFKKKKSEVTGFTASIPFRFPFYLPDADRAYEMQPPGELDSISTQLQPASTSNLPANDTQGNSYNSTNQ